MKEADSEGICKKKKSITFLVFGVFLVLVIAEVGYFFYLRGTSWFSKETDILRKTTITQSSDQRIDFNVPERFWGQRVQGKLLKNDGSRLVIRVKDDDEDLLIVSNYDVVNYIPLGRPSDVDVERKERVSLEDFIDKDVEVVMNMDNNIRSLAIYY